jgi:hypothetical protein
MIFENPRSFQIAQAVKRKERKDDGENVSRETFSPGEQSHGA